MNIIILFIFKGVSMLRYSSADHSKLLFILRLILGRMKLLTVMVIFILLSTKDIVAIPDCTEHICPEDDWQSTGSTIITWGACTFTAYWSFREITCTDYWCEFRLDRLFKNQGPDTCLTASNKFMVTQHAMQKILHENGYDTPCGLLIDTPGCRSNFSFTWAGCWKFLDGSPSIGYDTLVPCGLKDVCCWSTWQLCRDSKGKGMLPTKLAHNGLNPYCSQTCFGICEEFPPPYPSNIEENIKSEGGFKTFVFPNPSIDIMNISFISNTVGVHQIEVFDIGGNLIMSQSFTKQQNEELIQLKMGDYANGAYNYVIKHNGSPGINGSFRLLK